jgi:peptide/nickel transport system substrate-binding protein
MKKGAKTKVALLLIILLFTTIISSCTTNIEQPIEEIQEEEQNYTPVQGGTLSLSIFTPSHLNPIINQEEDSYHVMKLIYESLISLDENYRAKGVLAEEWIVQNNGESIIFNLRKDVTWHDDEPFTAKDVEFTLDVLKDKDVDSPYTQYINKITDYNIIDDYKIEISFSNSQSGNLEAFIFPVLPAHRYKKPKDVMSAHKWSPIGTGPYELNKYEQGKEILLKLNGSYWGNIPYIENIHVKIRSKKEEIVKSFETKDVDLLRAIDREWNRFDEDEQLSIHPYITQKYNFIAVNHNNELFKNVNIRKAIQLALNRQEMLGEIYLNQGEVVDVPISPNSWLYDKQLKLNSYNLEEAKKLIAESGLDAKADIEEGQEEDEDKNKKDNKDKKDKVKLEFDLIVNKNNGLRKQESKMVKKYIEAIGIDVNIEELPLDEINEKIAEKEFDAIITGWELSYVPDLYFAFHSSEIKEGMNFISYNNKNMNKLLVEASKYKEEQERKKIYSELQTKISQDLPYINLYYTTSALIVNNRIKGPINPTDYNLFNNIEEWFIEYE